MATRVSESIISMTSWPLLAEGLGDAGGGEGGAQAQQGRLVRGGHHDDGAGQPSGPRSSSRNSRTSRPRSPTRAMTETSASVPRAIMDSRDDLPTPEPAKSPMRWPRPSVVRVSSTRTPVCSGVSIRARSMALGASLSSGTPRSAGSGPLPSIGRPSPSMTRPNSPARWAPARFRPWRGPVHPRPTRPSGPAACSSRSRPAATTSASIRVPSPTDTRSPTAQSSPATSRPRPTTAVTAHALGAAARRAAA